MEARRALLLRDVENGEPATFESPSCTPVDAPAGQNIQQGNFLCQTQRVVERASEAAVPMRSRLVRAAAIVPIMCTDGQTAKLEKWCSASQTAS